MYAILNEQNKIVHFGDHPIEQETLDSFVKIQEETGVEFKLTQLPDLQVETIIQQVVRPAMLEADIVNARNNANSEGLDPEAVDLFKFLIKAIASLEYLYEAEFKYADRELEEKLEKDLLTWLKINKQLLFIFDSDEIKSQVRDINAAAIHWQAELIRIGLAWDAEHTPPPVNDDGSVEGAAEVIAPETVTAANEEVIPEPVEPSVQVVDVITPPTDETVVH